MRRECEEAIAAAIEAGAEYADARLIESRWHAVRTFERRVAGIDSGFQRGIGIRARIQGRWGFAAGTELGLAALRQLGQRAVHLGMGAALLGTDELPLPPTAAVEGEWRSPVGQDPFAVSAHEKADRLLEVENELRGVPAIAAAAGIIACSSEIKAFASSEGSFIVQERVVSGAGYRAFAETVDGRAERTFPKVGGHFATGGFEVVEAMDLLGSTPHLRDEATRLAAARTCPAEVRDLLLTAGAVAAVLHETLAHRLEADRLTGLAAESGATDLDPAQLGALFLASPAVTLSADPTRSGGLGTFGWDDDGTPAAAHLLVDAGRWVGVVGDRSSAARLDLPGYGGAARASGFNRAPMARLTNVDLLPGSARLEDLVAATERGLLVDTPWLVEVDRASGRFLCHAEVGWLIEGGRRYEIVRDVAFGGPIDAFWASCDAVGGAAEQADWGMADCRRGQPAQLVGVSHLTSPARFRAVAVGAARPPGGGP